MPIKEPHFFRWNNDQRRQNCRFFDTRSENWKKTLVLGLNIPFLVLRSGKILEKHHLKGTFRQRLQTSVRSITFTVSYHYYIYLSSTQHAHENATPNPFRYCMDRLVPGS